MRIRIQTCWTGHQFCFRALICGGLRIRSEDGIWTRKTATKMLDLLEAEGLGPRHTIRFIHV